MPGTLSSETSPQGATRAILRGMQAHKGRIWIPVSLRVLDALRALLHLPFA
jgi:hypothetical protein